MDGDCVIGRRELCVMQAQRLQQEPDPAPERRRRRRRRQRYRLLTRRRRRRRQRRRRRRQRRRPLLTRTSGPSRPRRPNSILFTFLPALRLASPWTGVGGVGDCGPSGDSPARNRCPARGRDASPPAHAPGLAPELLGVPWQQHCGGRGTPPSPGPSALLCRLALSALLLQPFPFGAGAGWETPFPPSRLSSPRNPTPTPSFIRPNLLVPVTSPAGKAFSLIVVRTTPSS
ncbi:uncharacterized protein ACBT57_014771 isoform 1-T1 [Dama dama]